MNVGEVQEYKLQMGEKEHKFRLDFRALMRFQDRYENSMEIYNNFLRGKKQYINEIKILSCAGADKDWKEEELAEALSFDFPTMKVLDAMAMQMMNGSLVVKDDKKKNSKEKNVETSQIKKS